MDENSVPMTMIYQRNSGKDNDNGKQRKRRPPKIYTPKRRSSMYVHPTIFSPPTIKDRIYREIPPGVSDTSEVKTIRFNKNKFFRLQKYLPEDVASDKNTLVEQFSKMLEEEPELEEETDFTIADNNDAAEDVEKTAVEHSDASAEMEMDPQEVQSIKAEMMDLLNDAAEEKELSQEFDDGINKVSADEGRIEESEKIMMEHEEEERETGMQESADKAEEHIMEPKTPQWLEPEDEGDEKITELEAAERPEQVDEEEEEETELEGLEWTEPDAEEDEETTEIEEPEWLEQEDDEEITELETPQWLNQEEEESEEIMALEVPEWMETADEDDEEEASHWLVREEDDEWGADFKEPEATEKSEEDVEEKKGSEANREADNDEEIPKWAAGEDEEDDDCDFQEIIDNSASDDLGSVLQERSIRENTAAEFEDKIALVKKEKDKEREKKKTKDDLAKEFTDWLESEDDKKLSQLKKHFEEQLFSLQEDITDLKEINDLLCHQIEKQKETVFVKVPVLLGKIKSDLQIEKKLDLPSSMAEIQDIRWTVSKLSATVFLPSNVVFLKGIFLADIMYTDLEKHSIHSWKVPIPWEQFIEVRWKPKTGKLQKKEYMFLLKKGETTEHAEFSQSFAEEVKGELESMHFIWTHGPAISYDTDAIEIQGTVQLEVHLLQKQYVPLLIASDGWESDWIK
ncbi:hypothetical protein GCM10010978_07420 [Compostibacillus humi]|uniref:Uncharacterized protein n=1 Tax=Compostibacillus humi TaxID=1245525 RepID=A0A8J2ZRH6_9BACI|nr:hypothetical protein [Compostibacillus humi]GGH71459.1 hypothetical protein GCM10010978_07420 [Compostibacillus humi]